MSRFTLSAKDKAEVLRIVEALPVEEREHVAEEVDDWMKSHHVNPLMMAAQVMLSQHCSKAAISVLDSNDDWHIKFDEVLRDLLIFAGECDRSVNVLIKKVA
jgi:hypothetical protein